MEDKRAKINSIISWKNEIDELLSFHETVMESRADDNSFKVKLDHKYVLKYILLFGKRESTHKTVELPENVLFVFLDAIKNYVEHLKKLVEDSDPELVEIAEAIRKEEITKKGRG